MAMKNAVKVKNMPNFLSTRIVTKSLDFMNLLISTFIKEYKSSISFCMFHFIFHQSQLVMHLFSFPYKIAKIKN